MIKIAYINMGESVRAQRILCVCLILFVFLTSIAYAQNDYGFRVLSRVLPGEAHASFEAGNLCYVGAGNVLQVYDITNPAAPVLLGQLPLKGQVEDVVVIDSLAYIANGVKGMIIADISAPTQIQILSQLALPGEVIGVTIIAPYAYVAALDGGLVIVDITNPLLPSLVSFAVVNQGAITVDASGSLACASCGYGGLYFFDISNPNSPTQLSLVDTTGTWVYDTQIRGNYAYMAYALDPDGGGLKIINIANPSAPHVVGNLITSYSFDRLDLNGNYAYIAAEDGGLIIVNITSPSNPTTAGAWHGGYGGNVSVLNSRAYLAGVEQGLRIISATNPASPQLMITVPTFSACQDVEKAGNYVYIVEKPSGIKVINLQNMSAPVTSYNRQFYYQNGAYQGVGEGISVAGNHLYVVDYSDINGGQNDFRVYGLTNPAQPDSQGIYILSSSPRGHKVRADIAYIATGPTMKILDVRTPGSIELLNNFEGDWHSAYAMDISGNYLYLGTMNTGLRILNIVNEDTPTIVGSLDTDGRTYASRYHNGYAYVCDDTCGLRIVNVANPASPFEVTNITNYTDCVDAGFVDDSYGSYAIILFNNQVVAYDIANPAQPVEVGYYETIDPHHCITRGDTVYVADRMNGLHVLLLEHENGVSDDSRGALPRNAILTGNYPNPFNSSTTIEFTLPNNGETSLEIYDIGGRKIAEPVIGFARSGLNRITWNGTDESGRQIAGGLYFYRVISGNNSADGKMIYLK